MGSPVKGVKGVGVDEDRDDLKQEKNPFGGPAEDKVVNQDRGGPGIEQGNGEPDADTGHGPGDHGHQQEKFGMPADIFNNGRVVFAVSFELSQDQEEAAADSKMGDVDVEDGDQGDQQAAAEDIKVPDRIIHDCTSLL